MKLAAAGYTVLPNGFHQKNDGPMHPGSLIEVTKSLQNFQEANKL